MDRLRAPSQISLDRKTNSNKDINTLSTGKQTQLQNELDQFLQQSILDPMIAYDPKLDFTRVPIVTRDQVLKQTRRQSYGLIWNPIRSPQYSRLIREDRCCAFVQILHSPPEWSRYDTDLFSIKIRQKTFLNGFALRDEFFRVLQIILKRDFSDDRHSIDQHYPFELKDVDFTRNMVQLVLNGRSDSELNQLTLVLSLVLLVEFDLPPMEFFPETAKLLCAHADFQEYFFGDPDGHRTRVTPFNSIKFLFDYSSTEANLCDYILAKEGSLSVMLKSFLKLRKEWLKYTQRAAKHATDTIKMQIQSDRQRQSTCSVHSVRSGASNTSLMNKSNPTKVPLLTEIEVACEFTFSIALIRLLFLSICSQYDRFGNDNENDTAFAIEKALKYFGEALEKNYLEHPFFPGTNILPESLLTYEPGIKIGIKKLIQEMQRDWKRNIRR